MILTEDLPFLVFTSEYVDLLEAAYIETAKQYRYSLAPATVLLVCDAGIKTRPLLHKS